MLTIDLVIERRINQVIQQNGGLMPYQSMLRRLQQKLEQERSQDKRDDIELQIVLVLGIINMQKGLNEVKASIAKMQKH